MRGWIAIGCFLVALGAAALSLGYGRDGGASSDGSGLIGVEALMRNADRYSGVVRVEGAVSATSAAEQTLTLIDRKELEDCGVTSCARLVLPVRWTGPMPAVRDLVEAEGQIAREGGRLIFAARTLKKIEAGGEQAR